ncbi:MAG: inorganic phosphate transporter [Thermoleophilia bacterium]
MDAALAAAVALALAFAITNGLHDAANAIATLVATRAARPRHALALAALFNLLGPLFVGAAVAGTIAGIVTIGGAQAIDVIAAALVAAVAWNLVTWHWGLPSSSGHALVGGLVGAALVAGGGDAVRWGGLDGLHPVGFLGALVALAVSPLLGALSAFVLVRAVRRGARRASRRWRDVAQTAQWATSATLAFSHGANDAQKSAGVIAALLLADGRIDALATPAWATLACAAALTAGTAVGGWSIVHTVGRGIYHLHPVDGLCSQGASAGVILGASLLGAPTSTTQVVASSVVGVGAGRRRWHHVRWAVVRQMTIAWLVTIPASAALAALTLLGWRWVA